MVQRMIKRMGDRPMVDASRSLVLRITTADIKGSKKKSSDCCAAARAICREHPEVKEAHVYLSRTFVVRAKRIDRYVTPQSLRTEIVSFDRAGIFEPGDYRLKPPPASVQLGYQKPPSKAAKTGKAKRSPHIVVGVRPTGPRGRRTDFE